MNVRPDVPTLASRSGIPQRSVERALARLEAGGWLVVTSRQHRQKTTYRICLERLATEDPEQIHGVDGAALSATVAVKNECDRQSGGQETSGGQENRPDFDEVADNGSGSEVRTQSSTASADQDRQSGGQTDVPQFLAWWVATYPLHNHGAQSTVDGAAVTIVQDVLRGRTVARLQAMALLLWSLEANSDPASHQSWIARSDRSLRVLRHKAQFLDRAVVVPPQQMVFGPMEEQPLSARELADAKTIRTRVYGGWCPHEPRCANGRACEEVIAWRRRAV